MTVLESELKLHNISHNEFNIDDLLQWVNEWQKFEINGVLSVEYREQKFKLNFNCVLEVLTRCTYKDQNGSDNINIDDYSIENLNISAFNEDMNEVRLKKPLSLLCVELIKEQIVIENDL